MHKKETEKNLTEKLSFERTLIYCFFGVTGLVLGADTMIKGAVELANNLSISKTVIGLTIIAFGTSLPEIAAAVASLFHRRVDMALGSIIGSNIFNIVAGLGITRFVSELQISKDMLSMGMPTMIFATFTLAIYSSFKVTRIQKYSFYFLYRRLHDFAYRVYG